MRLEASRSGPYVFPSMLLSSKWDCSEDIPLSQRPTQPPVSPSQGATVAPKSVVRKRVPFSGAYSFVFEEPPVERTRR